MKRALCLSFSVMLMVVWALLITATSYAAAPFRGEIDFLYYADTPTIKLTEPLLARLEQETGIKVNVIPSDYATYQQRLLTLVVAGSGPEIIRLGNEFAGMAAKGAIIPLDDYIAKDKFDTQPFEKGMLEGMRWRGKLWQIPICTSSMLLQYNKNIFDEAGVKYPTHDWDDFSWNWKAFVETAKRLTRVGADGKPVQWGLRAMQTYWVWPWYMGGEWVSADLKTYTGNSPETIKAVQEVADLNLVYNVQSTASPFSSGKMGMHIEGTSAVGTSRSYNFAWDFAASPVGTAHSVVSYGDGFGIAAASKHPELAWEAIKWLTSEENAIDFNIARYGGAAIPARIVSNKVRETWLKYMRTTYGETMDLGVIVNALQYAQPVRMRYLTNWSALDSTLNKVVATVTRGEKSASVALTEIAPVAQNLVDQGQ